MSRAWPRRVLAAALLAAAAFVPAASVPAQETPGPGSALTVAARHLQPAGRLTPVGAFPTGGAITPDGRFYWAVDAGRGASFVRIIDVGSGAVRQTLPLPGGAVGIAFNPAGTRAYVSGEPARDAPPGSKAPDGDVVHDFSVD